MNFAGLRPYQPAHATQIARALARNRAALDASDTGTGKMFVSLWAAREVVRGVPLVICPKSVVAAWLEAAEMMGVEIEVVNYEKARGVRPRGEKAEPLSRSAWGQEVAVGKGSRWVWNTGYNFGIFDEVDRCGGLTSLNSKMLIAARRQFNYLLCLSATAADDPRQLKALGFALRLFELRGFKWWLLKHGCKPGIWGGFDFTTDTIEQREAMVKIHGAIFPARGSRMRKADIPGFPKTLIEVKLIQDETGKAKQLALDLAEEFRNGNHLTADTALRQQLELLKVPHLVEMAEHYAKSSRVIIFVNFKNTISALRQQLTKFYRVEAPVIDGENTAAERETIRKAFQANQIPVLLCNNQAGGVGIGLHDPVTQVERTSLISPCYSARTIKQVFGRTPRDGGGFSSQFLVGFRDTREADVAAVVLDGLGNLDALNDALLHGVFDDPNHDPLGTHPEHVNDPAPDSTNRRHHHRDASRRRPPPQAPRDHQPDPARR